MLSTNIILLLCVVGFKADDGPSWTNINPNLNNLSTKKWKKIFNQYDSLNVGLISATELQKLLYGEFQVFLTIRQANEYTYLINLLKNHEIGLKQVKKMEPIIHILSQRNTEEEKENFIENYNLSKEVFVDKIASYFTELFLDKKEVLEVLKVVGHDAKLPIESKKYQKIIKMLTASQRMARIHKDFYLNNGDPDVDFLQYIRKHWLFSDESASLITNPDNPLISNINPNLNNLSPNKWRKIFNQYDSDNDGFISATQLQKLLYEQFNVFITIRHIKAYIREFYYREIHAIGLNIVKKMRPMIFVLSQREEKNKNNKMSTNVFVDIIASYFTELFLDKKEVLEVLKIVGHDEKSSIEWTEYHEIIKMLTPSLLMARIHKDFCLNNGDPNVDFLQYIRKHWLFRDESASLITNLDNPLMSNINPNLNNLSTKEWKMILNKYDSDNVGSISATKLQKLLYEQFNVFITIRQAEEYIYLIHLQENHEIALEHGEKMKPIINHEIGLEHVKKLEPIICILSQRKSKEKNESFIKNNKMLTEDFVTIIKEKFPMVFFKKEEVLELLNVVGHDEKLPIELTEYHEILKMLPATLRMVRIYNDYSIHSGVNKYTVLVSFPTWIRRSRLYREIPGSCAFEVHDRLKSAICL
ncbi:uncharacterized protein LOC126842160 [Adelges cooleyi]|uniref:uncharacterized protein LOC126842160 n=1 Tax=Adelges cooleyi TaxID=133065 RepID=UPI00217F875F|nr:uncharacterized protein LOC126842160 [Adelges cooleyi]